MDTQLRHAERTLTIYPQRSSLSKWLLGYWIMGVITLSMLVIVFIIYFSLFQIVPPFPLSLVTPMYLFLLGALLLALFASFPSLWPIVPITRCWWSPQPILSIDEQGITIYQQPMLKSVFLSWPEIATLSIAKPPFLSGSSILVRSKDINRFFGHSRWQRLFHRWLTIGRPNMFFLGPWFLTMPATELTSQIQETFEEELREYQLQIQTNFPYPAK